MRLSPLFDLSSGLIPNLCPIVLLLSCLFISFFVFFFFVSLLQVIFFQVLTHHEHEIVCLAYSRDDRFLVSVGDYRECSVVVWCTRDLVVLASSFARHPVHDIMWDPYTANEFCSVGQDGSVLFWLLDETGDQMTLNVCKHQLNFFTIQLKINNLGLELGGVCNQMCNISLRQPAINNNFAPFPTKQL